MFNFKARLVVKRFNQNPGIIYFLYKHYVKASTIKVITVCHTIQMIYTLS